MTTPTHRDPAPQIDTFVVLMKENHSFDNYFGMLGRGAGFTLDATGRPINSNPDKTGQPVLAHHLTLPFNPSFDLSQTWNASHLQWDGGAMDGFVTTTDSHEPMGYFDGSDLPWYYGFARTFGIGDRYFASCLAQTFPNRRYLQAATSDGLVSTALPSPFVHPPKTGLIWDRLDGAGITWNNYFVEVPEVALWPRNVLRYHNHLHGFEDFLEDCHRGRLPAVSLLTPDVTFASEGEYQDDQVGEAFTATVFDALAHSPQWTRSALVVVWDEGGGFYDHVPPPSAPSPDDVPPAIHVPPDQPGSFDRLGFRVPCLVASPFSKVGHVSSVLYDHTSILATFESKWGLGPLTRRDASAHPLWDFFNLDEPVSFEEPPHLPRPRIWPWPGRG